MTLKLDLRFYSGGVNSQIQTSLQRLRLYLERVERDLAAGDRNRALANVAELAEIARRLWNSLALCRQTLQSASKEET
jgi:hypothetical protein